ncbi:MAG: DUF4258 domain-containing protein [Spirochaetota bacterium]
MGDDTNKNLVFNAVTPLDFKISVTRRYWEIISKIKHPSMEGNEDKVKDVLENPDEIRISRSDSNVYLFYKEYKKDRLICAVAKSEYNNGFLITAYVTDKIKEGKQVWKK